MPHRVMLHWRVVKWVPRGARCVSGGRKSKGGGLGMDLLCKCFCSLFHQHHAVGGAPPLAQVHGHAHACDAAHPAPGTHPRLPYVAEQSPEGVPARPGEADAVRMRLHLVGARLQVLRQVHPRALRKILDNARKGVCGSMSNGEACLQGTRLS